MPASTGVDLQKHIAGGFLKKQFTHAFEYSDCWVQDARLVVLNARDAAKHGAIILTHSACIGLQRNEHHWTATIKDGQTGNTKTITAKAVVNASGPWTAKTLDLAGTESSSHSMRLVKGSHIIVKKIFNHAHPYIFQNDAGRILFAIPFENDFTLLGTTDHDFTGDPGKVTIDQQEIDYICQAVSQYTDQPINPDQVVWSYSGVRPLFDDASSNISKVSRDYELKLDDKGPPIVSVYGGKITTYRKLAEEVMGLLKAPMNLTQPAWTENSLLPGGDIEGADFEKFCNHCKLKYNWQEESIVLDYCRNYGSSIEDILQDCEQPSHLGEFFGGGLYGCEVIFLIEHEWAKSSDDILWRRSKKGLRLNNAEVERLQLWLVEFFSQQIDLAGP